MICKIIGHSQLFLRIL